jgi:hypothetical protein
VPSVAIGVSVSFTGQRRAHIYMSPKRRGRVERFVHFFPGFQTVVASIFLSVATGQPGLWPVAFAFSGVQCKCKALAKISCRVPTREAAATAT